MQLTILGNSAGGPFHGRPFTAQILQVENQVCLIDCGEGTQMQLHKYRIHYDRIQQIFISHLHGDHAFGLIGLLTNWCLKKRTEKLQIFSPPGLQEWVETTARLFNVKFPYELEFTEVDASIAAKVFENNLFEVSTIPLVHRTACSGWLFREKERPRNIKKEKITEYDLHFSLMPAIKAGADVWQMPNGVCQLATQETPPPGALLIPNAALTLPPPPPRSYAFCSDTAPSEAVAAVVKGVDLLYHEATFTKENEAEALISFHSTAAQAAEIARLAGVNTLHIGHFSGRYADESTHLAEATAIFEKTYIAQVGMCWEVGAAAALGTAEPRSAGIMAASNAG